jgi:PAS domain S-box-containing protein
MSLFQNCIAVVTGAGSGIGKAIALALASEGAETCLVGRRLDRLRIVAEEISSSGYKAKAYSKDLTLDNDIQSLFAELQRDCGRVDILVHSAGVISLGPIQSASIQQLDLQYKTNMRGAYLLTQVLLPLLRCRAGQIVFINSTAGLTSSVNLSQYAATKHGLKAIADSLRQELNPEGIRVLSLFVGRTSTPMQVRVHEFEKREYRPEVLLQPKDVAAVVISTLGLPRTAEVTDINIRPLINPAEAQAVPFVGREHNVGEIEAGNQPAQYQVDQTSTSLQETGYLDLINESVMTRTLDGRINFWNRRAEEIYGWRKDEAVGRVSHNLLQTQFPKPVEEIDAELVSKGLWEGRLVHITRDGYPVVVESRWAWDPKGQREAVVEVNKPSAKLWRGDSLTELSRLIKTKLYRATRLSAAAVLGHGVIECLASPPV